MRARAATRPDRPSIGPSSASIRERFRPCPAPGCCVALAASRSIGACRGSVKASRSPRAAMFCRPSSVNGSRKDFPACSPALDQRRREPAADRGRNSSVWLERRSFRRLPRRFRCSARNDAIFDNRFAEALLRRESRPRNEFADRLGVFARGRLRLIVGTDVRLTPSPQAFRRREDIVDRVVVAERPVRKPARAVPDISGQAEERVGAAVETRIQRRKHVSVPRAPVLSPRPSTGRRSSSP